MKKTLSSAFLAMLLAFPVGAQTPVRPRLPAAFQAGTPGAIPGIDPTSDLTIHKDVNMNSWFAVAHFEKDGHKLDILYHALTAQGPDGKFFVQSIASIVDETTGKSISGDVVTPFSPEQASSAILDLKSANGSISGDFNATHVTGKLARGSFDLAMSATSPALYNGGTGVFPMLDMTVNEFSVPRLKTSGTVTLDDKTFKVDGVTWFDRQWQQLVPSAGTPTWTWMGINLDNGDAISLWSFYEPRLKREMAWATILHKDGSQTVTATEPTSRSATNVWTSPSGAHYPTHWTVKIPQLDAVLEVVPSPREQEIASQLPMLTKYEGASAFTGVYKGKPVKG